MPYSYPEIKNFKGLYLQANSMTVPDGALEQANNAVIAKDGIVSKMRGSYQYLSGGSDTLKSTVVYKSTLFGIYTTKISRLADTGSSPNKTGIATPLSGTIAIGANRYPRTLEENNNLYVTTDNGVVKLDSTTATVRLAGAAPALDLRGRMLPLAGGILGDNQYGWRICFGLRDANNNLILSTPSDTLVLVNAKVSAAAFTRSAGPPYTITVTSVAHNLSTGMSITVTNGSSPSLVADHTVTVTTPDTFTFTMTPDPGASGTLDYKVDRSVRLEFSIPSEVTSTTQGYFYQIYRSNPSGSTAGLPNLDFALMDEQTLSQAEINAGLVVYQDDVSDLFRGAELYTNPGSREGEAQSNSRPPLCDDICLFKNHVFYGATTSRHLLEVDLVSASPTYINSLDWVEIKVGTAAARRYVARSGVGNDTVTATASGTGTITVAYTAHGLVNGDSVYVTSVTGTLPEGEYTISNVVANAFDITAATKTATKLDFAGLADASGNGIFQLYYSAASVAVSLRETASGLVRAINRDPLSTIYANYISSPLDVPGRIQLQAQGFGSSFSLRASSANTGQAFAPTLPTSFSSGVQVTSANDDRPGYFFSSKIGEPEAVPLVNYFPVGSQNKRILRMIALRDSVIILKEDGVWRIDGDSTENFVATALDKTAVCLATNSVDLINNQVIFLSNQGVSLASSNAVRIVSRDIEIPIKAVLGSPDLAAQTSGLAYESERLYFLTTILPGSSTADQTWVYNTLSDGWSTCDYRILAGCTGPDNVLYWVDRSNTIRKERKIFDRTDFCNQHYSVSVTSVSSDKLSAVIVTTGVPSAGDIIVKSGTINRITGATSTGVNTWNVTFKRASNLANGDSGLYLYAHFVTTLKLAPFHAGAVGRAKQFAQLQLHLRDASVSDLTISFAGQALGGSPVVEWSSSPVYGDQGWGLGQWGFFQWGQQDGTALKYSTQPAPIIRVYIPLLAQRGVYLQPVFEHRNAGEEINMQAVTFAVRGYKERVSR